jgi:Kef-type K+ transport system membrane component KefB
VGNIFLEITVVICLAAVLSLIFRFFKQPEILAYILTGIIIGPLGIFKISNTDMFQSLSQVGITLLLFMVGLEIKLSEHFSIGKSLFFAALGQIFFTFCAAYALTLLFGMNLVNSLYVSLALTFSSTIIIVKILSDKREMHSLYAKMSLGILLAQDLLAIFVLMFLSVFNNLSSGFPLSQFGLVLVKAAAIFAIVIYLSRNIFPKLVELIAKSSETLFLVSLAWVFGFAAFVGSPFIGFSIEIGGFLAGLSLANSIANYQIIAKAKILRDFFIVIFFVLLGAQMSFGNIQRVLLPALICSAFVLLIKPLIVMAMMGYQGYRKRTSFLTGFSLSQISEFSLILVFLGNRLGHIAKDSVALITLVGVITFTVSAYLVSNGNKFYLAVGRRFAIFEQKNSKRDEMSESLEEFADLKDHVVLIGGDQMGLSILDALEDEKHQVVVVDFDPNVIRKLKDKKVHRLFGDISDLDIQEKAKLDSAKVVISTIPDLEDNLLLLKLLNRENRKAKVVMMAMDGRDAKRLYKDGADYVVLPNLAGGRQVAKIISENHLETIENLRKKDEAFLG